jgi:hypothetical protein
MNQGNKKPSTIAAISSCSTVPCVLRGSTYPVVLGEDLGDEALMASPGSLHVHLASWWLLFLPSVFKCRACCLHSERFGQGLSIALSCQHYPGPPHLLQGCSEKPAEYPQWGTSDTPSAELVMTKWIKPQQAQHCTPTPAGIGGPEGVACSDGFLLEVCPGTMSEASCFLSLCINSGKPK